MITLDRTAAQDVADMSKVAIHADTDAHTGLTDLEIDADSDLDAVDFWIAAACRLGQDAAHELARSARTSRHGYGTRILVRGVRLHG